MEYRRVIAGIRIIILFFAVFASFNFYKSDVFAKEQTLTGTLRWGTNKNNGYDIIANKCRYEVNDGDTLILDRVDAYGDMTSAANNGIKVNEGGTLIVKDTKFHDARAIHIVMNGGTLHLYNGSSTPESYEFCAGKGTVYIHDGTWEANRHDYGGEGVFYMYPGSKIYVEGGKIGSITKPKATSKSYVTQHGIYAYGASVYMSGGTIENCLMGIWASNVYMSGGIIKGCNQTALDNKGNSNSFSMSAGVVVLYGTGEFTGGILEDNQYGIYNRAHTVFDGTIVRDNDYGIYHGDEYLHQKSRVDTNLYAGVYVDYDDYHVYDDGVTATSDSKKYSRAGIVLADEYYLYASENFSSDLTEIGSVYVMPENRRLGRVVVVTDYDKSVETTEYVKSFINLAFDGWKFRSGVGTNSDIGNLVLSKDVCVKYSKNFLMDGFEVHMKDDEGIEILMNSDDLIEYGYWREPCSISSETPEIIMSGDVISNMFFSHWNTSINGDGTNINPGGFVPGKYMDDDVVIYAFYDIMPDLFYRGNGQTAGVDYVKKYELGEPYVLDSNIFSKEGYSHQGWGLNSYMTYRDEGIYKAGDEIDIKTFLERAITNNELVVSEDGRFAINVYSVWDKFPELTTKDIVVLRGHDCISFEEIYGNIIAKDYEDGDLFSMRESGNDIGFEIINYEDENILNDDINLMPDGGAVMVLVMAVDGAKNSVKERLWIYINSAEPSNEQVTCYVRSINRTAYDTHDDSLGGCLSNSKWYEKSACISSINNAFDNLDNKSAEETYLLGNETRLSAIEWILNKGFSKSKSDSAIKDWGRTLDKT